MRLALLSLVLGTFLSGCSEPDDAGAGKTRGVMSGGATIGMAAPLAAQVLGAEAWVNERDKSGLGWIWKGGVLEIVPGTGNLRTREKFADCQIHVEFNVPAMPSTEWKTDGNSGVYIQRRYELQILNSHGRKAGDESCGALYTEREPDVNASLPAGEWQVYDIVFRAARWDGAEKTENARLTVYLNGQLIHDDVPIPDKTGSGKPEADTQEPLRLQDHGAAVRFRNVWIERLNLN
ncbi:MAG: hypothetical protein ACI8XO_002034 [Verrucomicrobiales bacterium]|jgi:hypothetical protein